MAKNKADNSMNAQSKNQSGTGCFKNASNEASNRTSNEASNKASNKTGNKASNEASNRTSNEASNRTTNGYQKLFVMLTRDNIQK